MMNFSRNGKCLYFRQYSQKNVQIRRKKNPAKQQEHTYISLLYHMAWFIASGISVRHDARTSHIKYFDDEFVLPINVVCQHLEVFSRILAEI